MSSATPGFRKILAIALPVMVLVLGFGAFKLIKANPPEASKRPPQRSQAVPVEATRLSLQDYTTTLRSFGSVQPRKQTTLVAQVSGMVSEVSPLFRAGSRFSKGDVLLSLDSSDYAIAVRGAQAALIQASALFTEEKARGDQAATDWKKLGKRGKPGALLLRTPQRQAAQAQVQAAQAQVERAELDLARTQIKAPYDGQVLSTAVDEGRFVTTGSSLGAVFASGALDVRLPLNAGQLQQMDPALIDSGEAVVELISGGGGQEQRFQARLVRSEGQIDLTTRQMFVVAEVEAEATIAIGQFVEAHLPGKRYNDVFVIPERLLRPEGDVFLATDGQVLRGAVQLLFDDGENAVVTGLSAGDALILTPLGSAVSGMRIAATIDGEPPARNASGGSGRPLGAGDGESKSGSGKNAESTGKKPEGQ